MSECLITRRGGETYKLPALNPNYPADATKTVISGNTTSASFSVSISEPGNPAEYTYQWYVNGSAVPGETGASYTKSGLSTTETYRVYCEVTNKAGTVTSRVATLNVTKYYTPTLNNSYPADATKTVIKGNTTSATFSVAIATDGVPNSYTYQWYKDGTAVSGATASTYTVSNLSTTATHSIYCKVTNAAGSVNSRTATLKVTQYYTPVLNSSYPQNATVVNGNSVTSNVTIATAGVPTSYTYQWYKNGSAVSGATSSSYTFTPTASGTTTVYCKVTNSAGTVQSRTATITATALYLYKNGDQCTAVTGGWSKTNQGSIQYNETYMQVNASSGNAGSAATANKINLTNFKTLVLKGYCNQSRPKSLLYVGDTSKSGFNYITDNVASIQVPKGTTAVEVRLDISGITGSYNVGFGASESSVYCYELYLE